MRKQGPRRVLVYEVDKGAVRFKRLETALVNGLPEVSEGLITTCMGSRMADMPSINVEIFASAPGPPPPPMKTGSGCHPFGQVKGSSLKILSISGERNGRKGLTGFSGNV